MYNYDKEQANKEKLNKLNKNHALLRKINRLKELKS